MDIKQQEMKELVVHHLYKVGTEELARFCLAESHGVPSLYWSDGIVFIYHPVPIVINSDLVAQYLKGTEHWQEVFYSEMKVKREVLELEDGEFKGARIKIVDASTFTPHREFIKWLKSKN